MIGKFIVFLSHPGVGEVDGFCAISFVFTLLTFQSRVLNPSPMLACDFGDMVERVISTMC